MTIGEILIQGAGILASRPTPRLDAELVLGSMMGLTREQLFCSCDKTIGEAYSSRFFDFMEQVKSGKPVSYITRSKEFFGRNFYVDERVLIPRPETEMIVEQAVEHVGVLGLASPRILDLGCGSGCIGLSLALELPYARVTLADVSPDALEVTTMNAERLGLLENVKILESDLLSNLLDQEFDVIVTNLPYIGTKIHHVVSEDVDKYEPSLALYGGDDGLVLYKKLFQQILTRKSLPKCIIGEFGFGQSDDVFSLLNTFFEHKASSIQMLPDLAGIDRVFVVSFL